MDTNLLLLISFLMLLATRTLAQLSKQYNELQYVGHENSKKVHFQTILLATRNTKSNSGSLFSGSPCSLCGSHVSSENSSILKNAAIILGIQ